VLFVRLLAASLIVSAGALGAGCSGGGSDNVDPLAGPNGACPLLTRMADTAASVEQADLSDPQAFDEVLEAAVMEYNATLDDLRDSLPDDLDDTLDRLEAAMEQYDFDEALRVRAPLDAYAEAECSIATTTTTIS
jgi:hypothetical protein